MRIATSQFVPGNPTLAARAVNPCSPSESSIDVPLGLSPHPSVSDDSLAHLRAHLSFAPISKSVPVMLRALPVSVQSDLLAAGPAFPTDASLRDATRVGTLSTFDKEKVNAWVMLVTQARAGQIAAFNAVLPRGAPAGQPVVQLSSSGPIARIVGPTLSDEALSAIKQYCDSLERLINYLENAFEELQYSNGVWEWNMSGGQLLSDVAMLLHGWKAPDFDEKTALGMQYALSLVGIEASIKQDIYGGFHVLIATDALDAILWMRTDDLQTAMSLIDAALIEARWLLGALSSLLPHATEPWPSADDPSSSWEIHKELGQAIAEMDENYLQVYEDAVGKYTGFFDDVNNVLGSMHKHLSTSESGKIFIESEFRDAVGETLRKWERDNVLIDGLNPSEATAWAESIGPLAYADGTKVKIDLSALRELQTTVYDSTGDWMSAHEFQAVNEALSVHKEKSKVICKR